MENIRAHILVTGTVQGVFFRESTRRAAEEAGVNGWVRNRRDGRVEVVAEGEIERVERLVDFLREGPPLANVVRLDVQHETYAGEFSEFRIAPTAA